MAVSPTLARSIWAMLEAPGALAWLPLKLPHHMHTLVSAYDQCV